MTHDLGRDDAREPLLGLEPTTIDADVAVDELGYDPDAMFGAVQSAVARDDASPFAATRSLGTGSRVALVTLGTAAIALGVGLTARRHDLATFPAVRLGLESALLASALVTTLVLALRPMHRPELDRARLGLALGASLFVAFAIALVPFQTAPRVQGLGPIAPPDWSAGLPCMTVGMLVAVPCYFVARLFDRGTSGTAFLAAAAAGLAANLALTLHCGMGDVGHRLSTHASQGVVLLLCLAIAAGIERFVPRTTSGNRGS